MRALVVVDCQNDFVDGSPSSADAVSTEGAVRPHIEEFSESGDDVYFTMDTHGEGYLGTLERRILPVPHCVRGTEGWMLHGRIGGWPAAAPSLRMARSGARGSRRSRGRTTRSRCATSPRTSA